MEQNLEELFLVAEVFGQEGGIRGRLLEYFKKLAFVADVGDHFEKNLADNFSNASFFGVFENVTQEVDELFSVFLPEYLALDHQVMVIQPHLFVQFLGVVSHEFTIIH